MTRRRRPSGTDGRRGFAPKDHRRFDRHDPYFRQAKQEGFVARSVYKLDELDRQFRLIRRADRVLDLGSAPGSWLQYVSTRVDPGRGGLVVGVDLQKIELSFPAHVRCLQGDAFDMTVAQLLPDDDRGFSVVLSDMAPSTTGIRSVDQDRSMALCERALELVDAMLVDKGRFCVKVLEGGGVQAFVASCRERFDEVKLKRPKSTRAGSKETFVVALGKKPAPLADG